MRNKKWTLVEPAGDYKKLDVGLYVVAIQEVTDHENDEYIECTFDVTEGPNAGIFAKAPDWSHSFKKYYSENSESFFRKFLDCLEYSNPQFSIERWENAGCNPKAFEGLTLGIAWQDRIYIPKQGKRKGETVTSREAAEFFAAQDVRNGDAFLPPVRDARSDEEKAKAALAAEYAGTSPAPTENQNGYSPSRSACSSEVDNLFGA